MSVITGTGSVFVSDIAYNYITKLKSHTTTLSVPGYCIKSKQKNHEI